MALYGLPKELTIQQQQMMLQRQQGPADPQPDFSVVEQTPERQTAKMNFNYTLPPGYTPPSNAVNIPTVSDPNQTYADMTRQQYIDFITNYGGFEEDLINQAQTDTSIIDQAREDVTGAQQQARDIAQRNISRYGTALTPAQQQEMQRSLGRSNTLGGIQALGDARLAQRDANQTLLADLINIGQGVNRSSLQQMGSAAADATARKNQYEQAKAAQKSQTYGLIGSLGAAAILAAFI
jgi:hypothetical protein